MLSAIILLEYEGRLGPNPTSGDRIKAMSDTVEALGLVRVGSVEETHAVKNALAVQSQAWTATGAHTPTTGLTINNPWVI